MWLKKNVCQTHIILTINHNKDEHVINHKSQCE